MNLYSSDWDVERAPFGVTERLMHVGRRLGGELLGGTVFEVEPGWSGLYHVHYANEELLLVLDGTPTLRTAEGERELERGDTAVFIRGEKGAHSLANRSEEPARFIIFSSMVEPDVVEYQETGTIGVIAGDVPTAGRDAPLELFFSREDAVGYFDVPRE
jgi:uncharacterized cupin superfamily protein